jgi:ABC-type transport system involved in multi-copper enzyme maturation permease subunit
MNVLKAELMKIKYSNILWITFIAFALAPLMGGIFILIVQDPEALQNAGPLSAKTEMMNFSASWNSYFGILTQAIGVGGVLIFGFVASWIFGREYSDNTAKDLLALPTSRAQIINAKFIIYIIWCLLLVVSNLLIGLIIGVILKLPFEVAEGWKGFFSDYFITFSLTVLLGTPIAFFALWGKGYLAPLGFVALTLVFAQVIAATGYGYYFPWSIPGLYSGAGGEYKEQLNLGSYLILFSTAVVGFYLTKVYWNYADQTK